MAINTQYVNQAGFLVETLTSDGLRLKGFWQTESIMSPAERTLWIVVHGVAGNFYDSSLLSAIASGLRAIGGDVLRINTRGHDPIAYVPSGGSSIRVGAAYETILDGVTDLRAWFEFAGRTGYDRIGFLGHSLGAVKVGLFASQFEGTGLEGVICVSPPCLNASNLSSDVESGSLHQQYIVDARRLCDHQKPEQLMTVRFPQPMLVAAATYLDKYGHDQYDYFQFASKIEAPALWTFGELETASLRASFSECDKRLAEVLSRTSNHRVYTIAKADHNYSLSRPELVAMVQKWIDALS